jgi:hypothetical protein
MLFAIKVSGAKILTILLNSMEVQDLTSLYVEAGAYLLAGRRDSH